MRHFRRPAMTNVNVPKTSPLMELAYLLGGLLMVLLLLYVMAGFAVDIVVENMSDDMATSIGDTFVADYKSHKSTPGEQYLENLTQSLNVRGKAYHVIIANSEVINAMALPGRMIVVSTGLLGYVGSENELAFVLSHEIAHFRNRDHLRGLGRSLVFVVLSSVTFGQDSAVTKFLADSLSGVEMRFSQAQESRADSLALNLVMVKYGHVGGAEDFLRRLTKEDKGGRLTYFFSTHPYPGDRLKALSEQTRQRGYPIDRRTPLDRVALGVSPDKHRPPIR